MTTTTTTKTTTESTGAERPAPRRHGTRIPARAQIMVWMLLFLVVILLATVLLVRNFLVNDMQNQGTTTPEQEAAEFAAFAQKRRDPRTNQLSTCPRPPSRTRV